MSGIKDDLSDLSPVKSYDPPKLPSLAEVRNDPAFLTALPERWKNNAKVLTCMGLIGASMASLSGCVDEALPPDRPPLHHGGAGGVPVYTEGQTEQDVDEPEYFIPTQVITEDLVLRAHYGGSGAGPFYVIYLTEQEVMSIIRSQLEEAGLRFNAAPPDNIVEVQDDFSMHIDKYTLEWYDEDNAVAVGSVGTGTRRWFADHVENAFNEQDTDFSVGVFYTPGLSPHEKFGYVWDMQIDEENWAIIEPDEDEVADAKERARPILEEQVNEQIRNFINFLISEGILTP